MKSLPKILINLSLVVAIFTGGMLLLFGLPATGWKALGVQTGSMSPNIPTGSMVFVHSVPTSSLKVGDVITYASLQKPGQTISHRITQTYMADGRIPGFVTKGDANKVADAPIIGAQVKGKVMFSVPYLGKVSKLLKTWPAIIIMIYLPALLVMIDEMRRLAAYYRTQTPYVLHGYRPAHTGGGFKPAKLGMGIFAALIVASASWAAPAFAQFQSNSVVLADSSLTVTTVPITPPDNSGGNTTTTTCTNTNNVNVSNNTNQTATTGSANNSGNTSGGNATSGNASNTNSTNVNVNVTNGPCTTATNTPAPAAAQP